MLVVIAIVEMRELELSRGKALRVLSKPRYHLYEWFLRLIEATAYIILAHENPRLTQAAAYVISGLCKTQTG